MVDRLDTAAAWLTGKLKTHASVAVVLERSNGTQYNLTATRGQTIFEGQGFDDGATVRIESADFIVDVVELGTYRPRPGDSITVDSQSSKYEVFAPDGDHAWRFSSAAEKSIRIHTRRVNVAETGGGLPLPP